MNIYAIEHSQTIKYVYPESRNHLVVRIKTAYQDIKDCTLIYFDRAIPDKKYELKLKVAQRDELFDYFETQIHTKDITHYIKYYFILTDKSGKSIYLSQLGVTKTIPDHCYFEYLYTNDNDVINVPKWANGIVYYQIFPERFNIGNKDKNRHEYEKWGNTPTRENFFGGDLKGITDKIPYIKNLGANCLYINPIFKATFNHKYDTTDYFDIDKDFGTKEDLKNLVSVCHESGIKVILDGVFNHVGVNFEYFKDVLENQEKSEYADWFYIRQYPVEISEKCYECVGEYKFMPKLKTSNPKVRDYIIKVIQYWIDYAGIDGWRFDVADEVDIKVWQFVRTIIKDKNPDILLLGETWGDGTKLISGDQLDSCMNYIFTDAMIDFFAKKTITTRQFDGRLQKMLSMYPKKMNNLLYNLLDSHDTERFISLCNGDMNIYKLAIAVQIMFIGSPAIYYGDEVGITGKNDPDCRKCMVWDKDKQNTKLLEWYKKFIEIRRTNQCIKDGNIKTIICDDCGLYGFLRYLGNEQIYVVINNSCESKEVVLPVVLKGQYIELLSQEKIPAQKCDNHGFYNGDLLDYSGMMEVTMPGYSVKIYKYLLED